MDGEESFLELSQVDNPGDIDLFQTLKSNIISKESPIPDQFQWLSLEIQSLSRHTQKTLKNMMIQLQRLGKVQHNEDLQPIARELNHHIQQSGMEYMRKMSWIGEKLRRQTILFASNDQDSILLEQSLLQDKENWATDDEPTWRKSSPSRILQETKLQEARKVDPPISTKVTPSKLDPNKTQLERASISDHSSSIFHHNLDNTKKSPESKALLQPNCSEKIEDMASTSKASIENNEMGTTCQGNETAKDGKEEDVNAKVQEEPVFQSVKDRIQKFSNAIHEQDRDKQLEEYTKATLLSKRSKRITTSSSQYAPSPERQVLLPSSSSVEEYKENSHTSQKSLEALQKTNESAERTEKNRQHEMNKSQNVSKQTETKKQIQSNSRHRSSSAQLKSDTRKLTQDDVRENVYPSSNRRSFSSGKTQLWTNLPPLPIENVERSNDTKQTGKSAQDKFSFLSKTNKSHKSKEKSSSSKMKKEEVTSLFSAFKHGWSKIAKPHDLQLFKRLSPSSGGGDMEAASSSTFGSMNSAMNIPNSLETSFPQSDLSRIHEPAVPLYPIQEKIASLQPTAPILSNNNSILSEQAISSANQDNDHWIDCQTTDGRHFRWNMCTQEVQWS